MLYVARVTAIKPKTVSIKPKTVSIKPKTVAIKPKTVSKKTVRKRQSPGKWECSYLED
jgi:hypothetical protein